MCLIFRETEDLGRFDTSIDLTHSFHPIFFTFWNRLIDLFPNMAIKPLYEQL